MFRPTRLAAFAAAVFACTAAQADTITISGTGNRTGTGSFNVPVTLTPAQLTALTSSGVTLNSITISGNAFTGGSHGFENREPTTGNNITSIVHTSSVNLNLPGGGAFIPNTLLDISSPPVLPLSIPSPYDGVLDFAGTSGRNFTGLSATGATVNSTLTGAAAAALLSQFAGGTANFVGNSTNTSTATGSGNLTSDFVTNSGANVRLVFDFTPPRPGINIVPEPASLACFGALLVGGLGYARRKLFA